MQDSRKLDVIVATKALLLSKIAPEAIPEHLISKNFLGKHPPDTPSLACLHTYASDIDGKPPSKHPGYGPECDMVMVLWPCLMVINTDNEQRSNPGK